MRIDSRLQENAGTKIDDIIEIRKVKVQIAKIVVLIQSNFTIKKNFRYEKFVKRKLNNYPITLNDYIFVSIGVSREVEFIVTNLKPDGVCIIQKTTDLFISDTPIELDYNTKETLFKTRISLNPTNTNYRISLAELYFENEEYKKAIEAWFEVKKINSNHENPWTLLGLNFLKKNDNENALDAFKTAFDRNPGDKTALLYLSGLYNLKGEFDKTIDIIDQLINYDFTSAIAWNNLCYAYNGKEYFDKAIKAGNRALEYNSKLANTRNHLGFAYYKKEQYKKAEKHLKKAIKFNPKYHQAYYHLSLVYIELKKYGYAYGACKRCLELEPNFKDGIILLKKLNNFLK